MGLATSCAAGGFQPTQLPGCVLWLRADLGVTTVSGNVSAWADQSGQGNNYQQVTAIDRPAYSASGGPNSTASINFTGTNSNCLTSVGNSNSYAQPFTLLMVFSCGGIVGTTDLFDTGNPEVLFRFSSATGFQPYAGTIPTAITISSVASATALQVDFNGASSVVYQNGSSVASSQSLGTNALPFTNSGAPNTIGCNRSGTGAGAMHLSEVVAFSNNPTATNRAALNGYLLARYGV